MSVYTGPGSAGIASLLANYQQLADEEKAKAPRRLAAQQRLNELMDELAAMGDKVDHARASKEMLGAFLFFDAQIRMRLQQKDPTVQLEISRFSQELLVDLKQYFGGLRNTPALAVDLQRIGQRFARDLQPSQINLDMPTIDIAVEEPADEFGTWVFAAVPVVIGSDYVARIAEKLDFDMYLTAFITPPSKSLTGTFNVPGKAFRAGEAVEPFIVTHTTSNTGQQTVIHFSGVIYEKGSLLQKIELEPRELTKQDSAGPAFDIESFMKTMGAGPGKHGPN